MTRDARESGPSRVPDSGRSSEQGYECVIVLTKAERDRVLWWLHRPVPPGPMKDLDVQIIRKIAASERMVEALRDAG